ncbi:DUF996 domain-containing protein [Staphylothermus hellenicus]|uniref:DUF996 domain-containing protein n=1 Tax=Staphylothermus hellenicus (strain DSM 12710 / JCM 10830 / BK20S6-10-b1 / P8) TaxID=591019 RepID=D7D9W5_STAHD|nr:DUF996 domain-containing protein [Staphylothermus hellenicus]ADI32561.1 protein of unknown function DUF996 [Staphylothermus hellenicus DSM 12710]
MDLESAKILGLVGVILELVGSLTGVSGYGSILSIVGLVLLLIAVHELAEISGVKAIFDKYLMGVIFVIIGVVIVIIIIIPLGLMGIGVPVYIRGNGFPSTSLPSLPIAVIIAVIIAFIIMYIFLLLGYIRIRDSYYMIADTFKHNIFHTVGTIYFIGAILTIILVGFIILLIGNIIELVAWATLPTQRVGVFEETTKREAPII